MVNRDVSGFFTWFLGQIYSMFTTFILYLDHIFIANNVSILDFTITIFILGLVITILIAQPGNAMRIEKGVEAREARERARAKRKGKG